MHSWYIFGLLFCSRKNQTLTFNRKRSQHVIVNESKVTSIGNIEHLIKCKLQDAKESRETLLAQKLKYINIHIITRSRIVSINSFFISLHFDQPLPLNSLISRVQYSVRGKRKINYNLSLAACIPQFNILLFIYFTPFSKSTSYGIST